MFPFISIIIPTRNRALLLARLLTSLDHLDYPDWEAIVVDDGSTDDTRQAVERFRERGLPIRYVYQPWRKMGAARNLGIAHAGGSILAFTDDDCTVDPGWLNAIADAFARHPEALGVQGRTVTERSAMTPFTRQIEQLEGGQPYRTCNIAYRTEIVRDLGGFDERLIRGEDVVMGARVSERGPILFAPDAVVCHPPRPKEWADRRAWRTLLDSETHFKATYPQYMASRSQTLSLQKPEHVLSRWVVLPVRRYWRWHYGYFRRRPLDYLHHVPLIVREKLALFSLVPYFVKRWMNESPSPTSPIGGSTGPQQRVPPPGTGGVGSGDWPRVSVVVPTRNRGTLLPGLLAALDAQDYPHYEVIVVDDASTDETPRVLAGWAREGRIAIRQDESDGSYAARNRGWRAASGTIVAFTDDDCLPQPGWLTALVSSLDTEASGAQGMTLVGPGEITPFTHQIEGLRGGAPYRTCNIAYRREVLERFSGFDDRLRWYADNILGLRVAASAPIVFAPDAEVLHPPRPREWRDRATWLERFRADAIHRSWLQRLGREPRLLLSRDLPFVLWVLRPLLKQTVTLVCYLLRHPVRFFREAPPMAREKVALLLAIRDYRREGKDGSPRAVFPALPREALVTVVVVTQDRPHSLAMTLEALGAQTWGRREVIVLDESVHADIAALAQRRGARYVTAAGPLGARRQHGLDVARGEIVAFTDDDCLPAPNWLATIVHSLRQDPSPAGVQGRTEAEDGPVGMHAVQVEGPDPLYRTCNIAYRRDALERAGGFDTRFVGHFEDTALGARVSRIGRIVYEPRMLVTHRLMPRHSMDRAAWRRLLADERLLAREYPGFYRRTRGPAYLPTVVMRWLIGSPFKTLLRELPRLTESPGRYGRLAWLLLEERRELIRALWR